MNKQIQIKSLPKIVLLDKKQITHIPEYITEMLLKHKSMEIIDRVGIKKKVITKVLDNLINVHNLDESQVHINKNIITIN